MPRPCIVQGAVRPGISLHGVAKGEDCAQIVAKACRGKQFHQITVRNPNPHRYSVESRMGLEFPAFLQQEVSRTGHTVTGCSRFLWGYPLLSANGAFGHRYTRRQRRSEGRKPSAIGTMTAAVAAAARTPIVWLLWSAISP
jgi:hypothetical protein